MRIAYKLLLGKTQRKKPFGNFVMTWRIILKYILRRARVYITGLKSLLLKSELYEQENYPYRQFLD
jgi:hypothetical protein